MVVVGQLGTCQVRVGGVRRALARLLGVRGQGSRGGSGCRKEAKPHSSSWGVSCGASHKASEVPTARGHLLPKLWARALVAGSIGIYVRRRCRSSPQRAREPKASAGSGPHAMGRRGAGRWRVATFVLKVRVTCSKAQARAGLHGPREQAL